MKRLINDQKPLLIVVTGPPGSGKSTCGEFLAKKYSLAYIDYDTVVQNFMESLFEKYYAKTSYKQFCLEWRDNCYCSLWDLVMQNIKLGNTIITSAPLTLEKSNPEFFKQLKESYRTDFDVLTITFYVPKHILKQRLIKRNEKRDKEKLKEWDKYYESQNINVFWDTNLNIILDAEEGHTNEKIDQFIMEHMNPIYKFS